MTRPFPFDDMHHLPTRGPLAPITNPPSVVPQPKKTEESISEILARARETAVKP
jgi:hypothetical protein